MCLLQFGVHILPWRTGKVVASFKEKWLHHSNDNAYLNFGFHSQYIPDISVSVPVCKAKVKCISTSSGIIILYSMK